MITKNFPAVGPIDADIALFGGSVTIEATARDDIEVEVRAATADKATDLRALERTTVDFVGERLSIAQQAGFGRWLVGQKGLVEVLVRIPEASRLTVKTGYGSIALVGEVAPAPTLETSYGDVRVDDVQDATLRTGYGEISADAVRGSSTLHGGGARLAQTGGDTSVTSTYGSITIGVMGGALTVRTSYGDVDVDTALGPVAAKTAYGSVRVRDAVRGALRLESSYGALEVGIREGTAAWLDVSSQQGLVRNLLTPGAAPAAQGDEAADVLEVYARTSAGDITIRRGAAAG